MAVAAVPREMPTGSAVVAVEEIQISLIRIVENVRSDVGDLAELADSIRQHGILQPIRIRQSYREAGKYELVYGQRRLAAASVAGLERIPAIVEGMAGGQPFVELAVKQLVENLQRRDLGPLEEARAFKALLEADEALTQAELARRIGRSAPYVSNALRILELDPKVLPLVASGQLSGSHAKALAALPKGLQLEAAKEALEYGQGVHELEGRVKRRLDSIEWETKKRAEEVAALQRMLAQLGKKKAPNEVPLYVDERYHQALKKAGYTNLKNTWAPGTHQKWEVKDCDCVAFRLDYNGKLEQTCISRKHLLAGSKAKKADVKAVNEAAAAVIGPARGKVAEALAAAPAAPYSQRLLLWCLMRADGTYGTNDMSKRFVKRRLGQDMNWKGEELWPAVIACSDAEVLEELSALAAQRLLRDVLSVGTEYERDRETSIRQALVDHFKLDPRLVNGKVPAKKAKAKP